MSHCKARISLFIVVIEGIQYANGAFNMSYMFHHRLDLK